MSEKDRSSRRMTTPYSIRPATEKDTEVIVYHRSSMFTAMGTDAARIALWEQPFRQWVGEKMASGEYLAFLAVAPAGEVVAGAGMLLHDWIPSPLFGGTRRGYVLNVFTEPQHRGQGLARRLVEECIGYCRAHEIRTVVLHASDAGRPIYDAMGFTVTNEMRLRLDY
jgi:ribosomal protein S18 acetylase RimI-like enzyme